MVLNPNRNFSYAQYVDFKKSALQALEAQAPEFVFENASYTTLYAAEVLKHLDITHKDKQDE